jgi:phospholipid/cholesterol/gamma-HCH transport system substrate-binding protein
VQFNGIRVGEVTGIELSTMTPQQVMATISVDRATPIRADTQVTLDFQGLMGVTSIALKGGSPQSPALTASAGALPVLAADPAAGADLTTAAREALRRLDGILADNSDALKGTIANLNTFTGALARNSDRIDGIVTGLERMTGGDAAKVPPMLFDLTAPHTFPPRDGTAPAAPLQLAVAEPTALIVFDTQRLIQRADSGSRTQIAGNAQWADTLPKLVQARLVQGLEAAISPAAVGRASDGFAADRQLLIEIRDFGLSAGPSPAATVELAAKLIGDGSRVLDARTFRATVPASSNEPPAAAAALDQAFGKAATDLVVWVRDAL